MILPVLVCLNIIKYQWNFLMLLSMYFNNPNFFNNFLLVDGFFLGAEAPLVFLVFFVFGFFVFFVFFVFLIGIYSIMLYKVLRSLIYSFLFKCQCCGRYYTYPLYHICSRCFHPSFRTICTGCYIERYQGKCACLRLLDDGVD